MGCAWCGGPIPPRTHTGGPEKKYCKPSHKTRAYEYRRKNAFLILQKLIAERGAACDECNDPIDYTITSGGNAPTTDHVIPVSRGGSDDFSNLRIIHAKCNSGKGNSIVFPGQKG